MTTAAYDPTVAHGRDPAGMASGGMIEEDMREPFGVLPPERSPGPNAIGTEPLPPTPVRPAPGQTPLMAFLVGAPPPPPPTPPPQKKRSRSVHRQRVAMGEQPVPQRVSTAATPSSAAGSMENTVIQVQNPTPRKQPRSPAMDAVIAERLRAARAMYQSDVLVSDPPAATSLDENARPDAEQQQENTSPAYALHSRDPVSSPPPTAVSTPVAPPSPVNSSTNTEPMSNHRQHTQAQQITNALLQLPDIPRPPPQEMTSIQPAAQKPQPVVAKAVQLVEVVQSRQAAPVTVPDINFATIPVRDESQVASSRSERVRRGKTPDRQRQRSKTPERRQRRPKTPEQRYDNKPTTPDPQRPTSDQKAPRGGFLRKLFSGGKKQKKAEDVSKLSRVQLSRNKSGDSSTVHSAEGKSLAKGNLVSMYVDESVVDSQPSVGTRKPAMKSSLPEEEEDPFDIPRQSRSGEYGDEVSMLTTPTLETARGKTDPSETSHMTMSDPMGRYFAEGAISSETIESINTPSIDPFAASDAVDPFTDPFFAGTSPKELATKMTIDTGFRKSGATDAASMADPNNERAITMKDPSPRGPGMQQTVYTIQDPSPRGTFVQEPSPRYAPRLSLSSQDPSPRLSTGGVAIAIETDVPMKDPVGESPLHRNSMGPSPIRDGTPYAPDPPLHLSNLDMTNMSDDSSGKSEDDNVIRNDIPHIESLPNESTRTPPRPPAHRLPSPGPRVSSSPQSATSSSSQAPYAKRSGLLFNRVSRPALPESASPGRNAPETPPSVLNPQPDVLEKKVEDKEEDVDLLSVPKLSLSDSSRVEEGPPQSPSAGEPSPLTRRSTRNRARRSPSPRGTKSVVSRSRETMGEPVDSDAVLEDESNAVSAVSTDDMSTLATSDDVSALTFASERYHAQKKKNLTVSAAARMSAKATAYIHSLNGEPSPRSSWNRAVVREEEKRPRTVEFKAKTPTRRLSHNAQQRFLSKLPSSTAVEQSSPPRTTEKKPEDGSSHLFNSYFGKFKSRRPGKSRKEENEPTVPRKTSSLETEARAPKLKVRDSVPTNPFTMGMSLLRERREAAIESGIAQRVTPSKKAEPKKSRPVQTEQEPLDPIQRAGRRLLSKAAVPIQASARRYLAQKQAVDRMWALMELQSHIRRWRAQAVFVGSRRSAVAIQRVFRGYCVRHGIEVRHSAAREMQRMVRGYITSLRTFDTVYRIILVQAKARGNSARAIARNIRNEERRESSALKIQSRARGLIIRQRIRDEENAKRVIQESQAATKIQSWWRCRSSTMQYQCLVVSVIVAQSSIRRWKARVRFLRARDIRRNAAASKIQSAWRGFQGYTDYIFSLVDIIVVQRTARQWFAKKKVKELRRNRAATIIQSHFRRYSAQMGMLYSLVHIIVVQSMVRRFLAIKKSATRRTESTAAAIKVQAAWRGFWSFSQYVIMQYEVCRIQALVRGVKARTQANLRLGSCIMLQSVARCYLAKRKRDEERVNKALLTASVESLRERHAATSIQFWWRVVLDCRKEKHAALVIERFFCMVKKEVDLAIAQVERKKLAKKRHRRKKKAPKSTRSQLDTVEEDGSGFFSASPSESGALSTLSEGVHHKASSPSMNLVMRHESPTMARGMSYSYSPDASTASAGITPSKIRSTASEDSKKPSEKYMKLYGIGNKKRKPQVNHFFADDLESTMSGMSSGSSIQGIKYANSTTPSATSPMGRAVFSPPRSYLSPASNASPIAARASPRNSSIDVVSAYSEYKAVSRKDTKPRTTTNAPEDEFGLI